MPRREIRGTEAIVDGTMVDEINYALRTLVTLELNYMARTDVFIGREAWNWNFMGGSKFASEYHDRWNRGRGDYCELLTRILMY